MVCLTAVGATAIAYELSWTRLLATPLGSSTYAFSLMLGVFLLGIAIGSALFESWLRKKHKATAGVFAVTEFAIAAAVLFSLWIYREIPDVLLFLLRNFGDKFRSLLAAQALTCALALLPATILFGFNFPRCLRWFPARSGPPPKKKDLFRAALDELLPRILLAQSLLRSWAAFFCCRGWAVLGWWLSPQASMSRLASFCLSTRTVAIGDPWRSRRCCSPRLVGPRGHLHFSATHRPRSEWFSMVATTIRL